MREGRTRIRGLGLGIAFCGLLVALQLYVLMIEQRPQWLDRSYRNRWVFQDVPIRRGELRDRRGRMIARDRPAFAVRLDYRSFRRYHALGAIVHGANLTTRAAGLSDDFYGFARRGVGVRDAFHALLSVPADWLHGDLLQPQLRGDLRFYAASMLSGLEMSSRSSAYAALPDPQTTRPGERFAQALGADRVAELERAFEVRLAEFGRLIADLEPFGRGGNLWDLFESRRRAYLLNPRSELRERRMAERVPFELAARVTILRERQRGVVVRPSVRRERGKVPGRTDLASLGLAMGTVTPYWLGDPTHPEAPGDEDTMERRVDSWLGPPVLDSLVPRGIDLPPELAVRLEEDARRSAHRYLLTSGRIGRYGLEHAMDDVLSGRPGLHLVERDRQAESHGLWGSVRGNPGQDVVTTIDLRLQSLLENALDTVTLGSAIGFAVIDPRTGDILALGDRTYPPDGATRYLSAAAVWPGNGSIGSVAKPLVLLEQLRAARRALPHRAVSEFHVCDDRGYKIDGGRRSIGCSHFHGADALDPVVAIAESCNVFFYQVAEGLGEDGLARAYQRFGLMDDGRGTHKDWLDGIAIPGLKLAPPQISTATPVQLRAIGYDVRASTLSVARAYAGLATGGLPRLGLIATPREAQPLDVDPADLRTVRDGLYACVRSGTARHVNGLAELGVLAKTGTAEINRAGANNACFAGFVSERQPTLAFAAIAYNVPDGHHGASVAGTMVAEFLLSVARDPELQPVYLPEAGR